AIAIRIACARCQPSVCRLRWGRISKSRDAEVSRRALFAIACATALSRWLVRARIPDDYDSFSFLLGMRDDWNLALFQPQFPGYPVYVALGRGLIRLGVPAMAAPTLIAAIASGVTVVALARIAEHLGGARAAYATVAL